MFLTPDHTVIDIRSVGQKILRNSNLEWSDTLRNDEAIPFQTYPTYRKPMNIACHQNLVFEYYPATKKTPEDIFKIRGSLQKFLNNGESNFIRTPSHKPYSDLLKYLQSNFDINPEYSYYSSIDTNIDFKTHLKPKEIIPNILFHSARGIPFKSFGLEKNACLTRMERTHGHLKGYAKSIQQGFEQDEYFRWESKIKTMQSFLKRLNHKRLNLNDLLNKDVQLFLKRDLIKKFDDSFVFDQELQNVEELFNYKPLSTWLSWSKIRNKVATEKRAYDKLLHKHNGQMKKLILQEMESALRC